MDQKKSQSIFNIFPLTFYKTKVGLNGEEREVLIEEIYNQEKQSKNIGYKTKNSSWTGDTQGHEFLFLNKKFNKLFSLISIQIKEYTKIIGIDSEMIDYYYQRAWATISKSNEGIKPHKHMQSHISFAYYLKKDKDSGKLVFHDANPHNEIAPGIFSSPTATKLVKANIYNTVNVRVDTSVDDIIIFPSKSLHSVLASEATESRVSISADVSIVTKDSTNSENLLTPVKSWMKF